VKRIIPKEMLPTLPRGTPPIELSAEGWPTDLFEVGDLGRPLPALLDWHNEAAYPKPEDLSHRAWGWEFLRRNPEYLMDWYDNQLQPARWGLAEEVDPAISPHEPALAPGWYRSAPLPTGGPRFRARRSHYPTYLRIWDARCAGALIAEIGATLYPGRARQDDDVKKDIEAALRLVWFAYEALLAYR
jgi:hypothetical protein